MPKYLIVNKHIFHEYKINQDNNNVKCIGLLNRQADSFSNQPELILCV